MAEVMSTYMPAPTPPSVYQHVYQNVDSSS